MKSKKFVFSLIIAVAFMSGACKTYQAQDKSQILQSNENLVLATLYYQQAAEVKALYLQAYSIAKLRLDQELAQTQDPSKLAIVLDIDETVLDNSPYEGKTIRDTISYPTEWDKWIFMASAEPLPGALDFLNYADSKKAQIFYITNRKAKFHEATMKNLADKGFPQVAENHLMLKTAEDSKENRRLEVLKNHRIILLIGDNLSDFDKLFDQQTPDRRSAVVDSLKTEFGKRFIILPNPMYGDWLNAIYNYDNKLTFEQRKKINLKVLKGF